jgi:superfamily II DNA or RNA helicase
MPLRLYQKKAIESIRDNFTAGKSRQLLCMATGTGKTEVFAHLPEELKDILPGQMMVLLHRDELAQQAYKKIMLRNPGLNVQIEAGSSYADPDADVIIASVQTLGRAGTKRCQKFNWPNIDKLVIDEAHRSIADSYYNVYNAGGYLNDSKRLVLGVTATPTRGDGSGLSSLYQCIPFTYSLQQAIEDGYLVDVRGIRVYTATSLDGVGTSHGDFDQSDLADAVNNPLRNNLVANAYLSSCSGRTAIGFAVNIAHAQSLAATFQANGINAEAVWGADPDRDKKIKAFREGKIQVLFNAQLLVEGFDMADISCVILAAPTKSGVVFSQRVGRGTRLGEGKEDCIILDVVDSTYRHSLITLPTLIGLPSGLNLQGHGLIWAKKEIEAQLEQYPHLDLTGLSDVENLKAYVENVNLFQVKFPPEVEAHSQLTWHPSITGGYVLMLPDKDEVRITQNLLDKFEISARIKGKKYKGERDTIDAAFGAADNLILTAVPEVLNVVKRDAKWHSDSATPKQMKRLRMLYKGKQIPPNITKGEASKLIGQALAAKGKK